MRPSSNSYRGSGMVQLRLNDVSSPAAPVPGTVPCATRSSRSGRGARRRSGLGRRPCGPGKCSRMTPSTTARSWRGQGLGVDRSARALLRDHRACIEGGPLPSRQSACGDVARASPWCLQGTLGSTAAPLALHPVRLSKALPVPGPPAPAAGRRRPDAPFKDEPFADAHSPSAQLLVGTANL